MSEHHDHTDDVDPYGMTCAELVELVTDYLDGALPASEGPSPKPFRNHLPTVKVDFEPAANSTIIVRYAREDSKRQHDFIGGNTLANSGALNTNVIDSFIAKDTSVMGSKLNEFVFGYSRYQNNITAENPTRVTVREGQQVELTVRGSEVDSVMVLDEIEPIEEDSPAVFEILADEPGEYPIQLIDADRQVGTLVVRARS